MHETLANRSFLALFGAGFFSAMAAGLVAALSVYFNTFFWELTSSQISLLVVANFPAAAAALAIAPGLSARCGGKKPAAIRTAIAACVLGPAGIILRLVGFFPANHSPALLPVLLVTTAIVVTLVILSSILVASMVADVVEDSEVTTGRRSEGLFFAANSFIQKSVSGVGIFASTVLLSMIGFPQGAQPGEVDPLIVRNLGLVYIPVLILLNVGTLGFPSAHRISRATHEANLERLARGREAAQKNCVIPTSRPRRRSRHAPPVHDGEKGGRTSLALLDYIQSAKRTPCPVARGRRGKAARLRGSGLPFVETGELVFAWSMRDAS